MKCNIVNDLLTSYIDGLCSEETNGEIADHLDHCTQCHIVYEKMSAASPQEIAPEDKNIDFLKKLRARTLRKNVIVSLSTCLVVIAVFFVFAKNYDIPLPFDANRMMVEEFKAAVITNEDGTISFRSIDPVLLGDIIPEDSSSVIDSARTAYRGINHIGQTSIGRTINRKGENVRVVYYCYTKTLWDSLFIDPDLLGYSESGTAWGSHIYGDDPSADYEPQTTEFYYLPIKNLHKFNNLSDQEYDNMREKGALIWSGVI